MLCSVCCDEIEVGSFCDGCDDVHALCVSCATGYLTKTIYSQHQVPKWGERVKCVQPGCFGMIEVDDLVRGMDPDEKKKAEEQIARSIVNGMSAAEALNVVFCDSCDEYYYRESPGEECFRCRGNGKLTNMYAASTSEVDPASAALIQSTSMRCKKCSANITRNGGCNHMTCTLCAHEFCYVCGRDWDAEPRCEIYSCRAQKQAEERRRRSRREETREPSETFETCFYCAVRAVACPHMALLPRGPQCMATCPRTCTCEYSKWVEAWLQFRPRPGAEPEYFCPIAMEKTIVAHNACVKVRGVICRICRLRGHNPDSQRGGRYCPLIEMVGRP